MSTICPRSAAGAIAIAAFAAACSSSSSNVGPPSSNGTLPAPRGLIYQLSPGEQVGSTADSVIFPGVVLSWLPGTGPDSNLVNDFVVYGSDDTTNANGWARRAITTSLTFHDAGQPQQAYYVTSQDVNGAESVPSARVRIDPTDTVATPAGLTGTALNAAVELQWQDNALTGANAGHFDFYRVYSSDTAGTGCSNSYVLEGQSVSSGFVITGLANDVPRCYWVSSVTRTGHESAFSNAIVLTPSASQPPYTAARISANATIVAHHPIELHRHIVRIGR
jgi:hypothetical protein